MPNLHPIPEADLPPISPDRHFFYCPNPLDMTDAELETQFPRQQRIEFLRDLMRLPKQRISPATVGSTVPEAEHADPV